VRNLCAARAAASRSPAAQCRERRAGQTQLDRQQAVFNGILEQKGNTENSTTTPTRTVYCRRK